MEMEQCRKYKGLWISTEPLEDGYAIYMVDPHGNLGRVDSGFQTIQDAEAAVDFFDDSWRSKIIHLD